MTKINIIIDDEPVKSQVASDPSPDPVGAAFGLGIIVFVCVLWLYQLSLR